MSKLFSKPKALLGITLVLCMILSMLPIGILSVSAAAWNGSDADPFAGGDGSENDPWQIATGAQLAYLAQQVNSGEGEHTFSTSVSGEKTTITETYFSKTYFKLMNDIDLGDEKWSPIGVSSAEGNTTTIRSFCGILLGNNHVITGLRVEESGCEGFVGVAGHGATIENLSIQGNVITTATSGSGTAGFVGDVVPGHTLTISNCVFTGTVSSASTSYPAAVGAFVGYNWNSVVKLDNCIAVNATITDASGFAIGGLVGVANSGTEVTITNSSFSGTVTGGRGTGGLVGAAYYGNSDTDISKVTITNSYSEGTINSDAISGGLVGMLYNREYRDREINITITDSYSTATLKTDKASGGLVGANDGYNDYPGNYTVKITNSHFAGKAQYPILNSTIDRSTVKTPMTVNLTNVYYVEGTYTAPGVEFTSVSKVEAVSAGQLADGTVTDLLNGGRDVWKQGATHPVLEVETTPLKTLMVNDESVDTAKNPFAYDAGSVEADVNEIEIEATPVQSNAKVLISAVDDAGKVEVPESGGNTVVVPLAEGRTTTITIAVTHNFQTTNYTVSVYRKPRPWTGGYEEFANYDDNIATSEEKVYEIANADQLAFFAKIINEGTITAEENRVATVTLDGKTYQIPKRGIYNLFSNGTVVKLTADIDLGNMSFKAIGYNDSKVKQFGGTFDGDGHEIKNLTINEQHEGVGLFTKVGYGGAVKNLTVRGSVTNTGTSRYTGGIAGQLFESATLENCAFIGDVVSGAHNVGGLAGGTSTSGTYSLTNCYSSGTVTAKGHSDGYTAVGGLLGDARSVTTLTNCYSIMTIKAADNAVTAMMNGDGVGGLIGKLNNTIASGEITYDNCYFAGDVCSSYPISPMTNGDVVKITNKLLYKADSFNGEVEGAGTDNTDNTGVRTAAEFADGTVAKALGDDCWATSTAGYPVHSTFVAATNALGIEGTSIRTSTPNGLRFHFKVNETAQTANLKEFGVIVAKANSADNYGLYLGSAKSAYLPAFVKGTDPKFVRQNIPDTEVGGVYDWFTARVDFKEESNNYTTDYSARAYAVYEDNKGQEVVIYSDLIDHKSYYTSLSSIAAIALEESAQTDYEDSEKAYLQAIVDAVEG